MKFFSLVYILLFAGAVTTVNAQRVQSPIHPSASSVPHEHIGRVDEEITGITRLLLQAQAIVLGQVTTQTWENDSWVNASRTTYDYEGDLESEAVTETWVDGSWENETRTLTTHSGGDVEATQFETWNGSAWTPEFRTLYAYSGDILLELHTQDFVDGDWVDNERTSVTLSGGLVSSTETEVWDGNAWVPTERFTIEQDGADVVAVSEEWDGAAWINMERTVYPGITVEELFEMLQEFAMEEEAETWGFSALLRFPDTIAQEWDGSQWVNLSRQISERDEADRPVAITLEAWEDGAWIAEARYVAEYDAAGQITTLEWQMFADEWTPFLVETYYYDNAGLLERIVAQYDFGVGLANSSQFLFEWMNTSSSIEESELPGRVRLAAPYPNPFNPQSTLQYYLAAPEHATLRVFDPAGRLVATLVDGVQSAGDHEVVFDAAGLPSGVYLIRLQTPSHVQAKAVTLLR